MVRPFLLVCALLGSGSALANDGIVRGSASDLISFERWCADVAQMSESRCAQRLKPDYDEFVVYRDSIEQFETEFLREKTASAELRYRVETQDDLSPQHHLDR